MLTSKTRCAVVVLACLGLGVLLLPVFGESGQNLPVRANGDSVPLLGVVPAKAPPLGVLSARDPSFPQAGPRDATGDTYLAAGIVQDATSAWYVDDYPDNHTFGTGDETAGANLLSEVDTRIAGMDQGPGLPGTNLLQVNYYTSDSSDIVPSGSVSPNGTYFESWRFDVGTVEDITDRINRTPNPGFTVVDSGFCVAEDGGLLGCWELAVDDSDANGVSGIGIVGLEGADIAGYGVDEMVMYWEIQLASSVSPADFDQDGDVDLADFAVFQGRFDGP